jgi:HPt (histidine-containing phosphotransfer) domain-containing protein
MIITATDIEQLIKQAKDSGVPPNELEDLKEHLEEVRSEKLMSNSDATFYYQVTESDGRRVISISTAPVSPDDNDDFEGASFKPIKRGLPRSKS